MMNMRQGLCLGIRIRLTWDSFKYISLKTRIEIQEQMLWTM